MSLYIDSVTGVDVALEVAGPGARAFAFVLDFTFRTLIAGAWYVVAASLYNHHFSLARPLEPDSASGSHWSPRHRLQSFFYITLCWKSS